MPDDIRGQQILCMLISCHQVKLQLPNSLLRKFQEIINTLKVLQRPGKDSSAEVPELRVS